MLTIHLCGGTEMCQAAVKGRGTTSTVQILGVTVLTSQTEATLSEIGIQRSLTQQVLSLAALAKATGVTGLIASPLELEPLRNKFGKHLVIVTPGVRPTWSTAGDQKRFTLPRSPEARRRLSRDRPSHHRRPRPASSLPAHRIRTLRIVRGASAQDTEPLPPGGEPLNKIAALSVCSRRLPETAPDALPLSSLQFANPSNIVWCFGYRWANSWSRLHTLITDCPLT